MLGFLFGKKKEQPVKISLATVTETLARRHWDFETVNGKENVIVVNGKYRNHQRDFSKLFLHFVGEKVQFKDERGYAITHCQNIVSLSQMYPTLKNILNVL